MRDEYCVLAVDTLIASLEKEIELYSLPVPAVLKNPEKAVYLAKNKTLNAQLNALKEAQALFEISKTDNEKA